MSFDDPYILNQIPGIWKASEATDPPALREELVSLRIALLVVSAHLKVGLLSERRNG